MDVHIHIGEGLGVSGCVFSCLLTISVFTLLQFAYKWICCVGLNFRPESTCNHVGALLFKLDYCLATGTDNNEAMYINSQPLPLDGTICQERRTCCGKRHGYKEASLPLSDSSYTGTVCAVATVQFFVILPRHWRQHILWTNWFKIILSLKMRFIIKALSAQQVNSPSQI